MGTLSNGWKVPTDIEEMKILLNDFERNIVQMEKENPLTIFKENMENGILYKASLQDATNHLNTFTSLYLSAMELREMIIKKID
jgi:hypothetical protein